MTTLNILSNKSALITGGSKGIGFGIALSMAELHMKVAITSRKQDEVDMAAEELRKAGAGITNSVSIGKSACTNNGHAAK